MTRLSVASLICLAVAACLAGCPVDDDDDPSPPAVDFQPQVADLGSWVASEALPEAVELRLYNRGQERVELAELTTGDTDIEATAASELPVVIDVGGWVTVRVAYAADPTGPLDLDTWVRASVTAIGSAFDQRATAEAPVRLVLDCDADDDGYTGDACAGPDCDDFDPLHSPATDEVCNGLDDDCDGEADADGGERDDDGDGWFSCEDCDDDDAGVHPGVEEACDGQDTDCNPSTFFVEGELDYDSDGFLACEECDDLDHDNAPGNAEVCDGQDNDCDGSPSPLESDDDGDGYSECDGDCDDLRASVAPFLPDTPGDGIDTNCDGED